MEAAKNKQNIKIPRIHLDATTLKMLIFFIYFFLDIGCFLHYFCKSETLKINIMARPIRETPILYGEAAKRFEERMKIKRHEDPKERELRLKIYNALIKTIKM
jgi:hypothetical protein